MNLKVRFSQINCTIYLYWLGRIYSLIRCSKTKNKTLETERFSPINLLYSSWWGFLEIIETLVGLKSIEWQKRRSWMSTSIQESSIKIKDNGHYSSKPHTKKVGVWFISNNILEAQANVMLGILNSGRIPTREFNIITNE